jgi:hypothetical protein
MPKAHFLVRAVVSEPLRDKFDHWYATDHLPRAHADLKSEKCFRLWSTVEPGVHYAVYEFADMAACDVALKSQAFKDLVADFDRNFPEGVTRTRDVMTLVQEVGA